MPSSTSTVTSGGPLLPTLRRWWWLPLLGAVLGAVLGLMAGSSSTYTATALVQSRVTATDAQAVAQGAQTALAALQTPAVYERAAKARGVDLKDLTDRTRTSIIGDSAVISIDVKSTDSASAIADANALAQAAVAVQDARVDDDLTSLRKRIVGLLDGGQIAVLPKVKQGQDAASSVVNGQAELSRQDAVGKALGDAQSEMVAGQGRVSVLEPATDASVGRDISKGVAAMATVGGLLLGLAAALVLGTRGSKVRSVAQVRSLYPRTSVVADDELPALLDLDLDGRRRVLVVGTGSEGAGPLSRHVRELAAPHGVDVVTAEPGSALVDRLSRDPETLVLVDAPRGARVGLLDRIGRSATDDTVVVVRG